MDIDKRAEALANKVLVKEAIHHAVASSFEKESAPSKQELLSLLAGNPHAKALLGALAGSGGGSLIEYLRADKDDKDKRKKALKGALVGALLGGGAGYGLHGLGKIKEMGSQPFAETPPEVEFTPEVAKKLEVGAVPPPNTDEDAQDAIEKALNTVGEVTTEAAKKQYSKAVDVAKEKVIAPADKALADAMTFPKDPTPYNLASHGAATAVPLALGELGHRTGNALRRERLIRGSYTGSHDAIDDLVQAVSRITGKKNARPEVEKLLDSVNRTVESMRKTDKNLMTNAPKKGKGSVPFRKRVAGTKSYFTPRKSYSRFKEQFAKELTKAFDDPAAPHKYKGKAIWRDLARPKPPKPPVAGVKAPRSARAKGGRTAAALNAVLLGYEGLTRMNDAAAKRTLNFERKK